jgi:hypothetical protein
MNNVPQRLMYWLSNVPLFLSIRCNDTLLCAVMGLYVLASPQHKVLPLAPLAAQAAHGPAQHLRARAARPPVAA